MNSVADERVAQRWTCDDVRENPAWSNRVLKMEWKDLARIAPKALPVIEPGRKFVAKEYGAGFFGVVLPTMKNGIVLKITVDPSEARLAYFLSRERTRVPGIVRYYAAVKLSKSTFKHEELGVTPVYALWREEAYNVANVRPLFKRASDFDEFVDRLWEVKDAGGDLRHAFEKNRKVTESVVFPYLDAIELLSAIPEAEPVADAFEMLAEASVVMSDVHDENVGANARGKMIITDPGRVVFLKPEHRQEHVWGVKEATRVAALR